MRIAIYILGILCYLSGCTEPVEEGAFITYLGADTLAAEHYVLTGQTVEATVMLRSPRTTLRQYSMKLDDQGFMKEMSSAIYEGPQEGTSPIRTEHIIAAENGFDITVVEDGEETTHSVEASPEALPFLDMIHWPYDLVLKRASGSVDEMVEQPLLAGRRSRPFEIQKIATDSVTIKHPSRGTMGVTTHSDGRIQLLDASQTTRKVRVVSVSDVNVNQLTRHFSQRDTETPFGPLSGRGEAITQFEGGTVRIDYGTPSKRGRDIFGVLVPWEELWRTGANRATHIETEVDLMIGDLAVPAGTYTLYTIPAPDGGTLIVNTETGQGGTTYNEDMDLGRVPMTRISLDDSVEIFTISIEGPPTSRTLHLKWDQTAFTVPVREN